MALQVGRRVGPGQVARWPKIDKIEEPDYAQRKACDEPLRNWGDQPYAK